MDEEADRAAEAASAAAVGLPVEGWLAEALRGPILKQLEEAGQSADIAFAQSAVEAARLSALPVDSWTDVVQLLS
eukprot:12356779-Alexandrium_andersonii.AAC.1